MRWVTMGSARVKDSYEDESFRDLSMRVSEILREKPVK